VDKFGQPIGMRGKGTTWVTAMVRANFGWPTARVEFMYRAHRYLVRPETDEQAPSLSVYDAHGLTVDEGRDLINRVLSALAWAHSAGARVDFCVGSNGDEPVRVGPPEQFRHIADPWEHMYLPLPKDERALRALAVFREALSLNSVPYKFLGLFKILNIRFSNGPEQIKWINENRRRITDSRALERMTALSGVADLGEYLYVEGRCAVAHAYSNDVVDPDVSKELRRLEDDMPLMKAFAELMISVELGVLTASQFWASLRHIYRREDMPPEYVKAKQVPAP